MTGDEIRTRLLELRATAPERAVRVEAEWPTTLANLDAPDDEVLRAVEGRTLGTAGTLRRMLGEELDVALLAMESCPA